MENIKQAFEALKAFFPKSKAVVVYIDTDYEEHKKFSDAIFEATGGSVSIGDPALQKKVEGNEILFSHVSFGGGAAIHVSSPE